MAVSTMVGTAKKLQFGIFVFVEVQKPTDEAICKVVNVMEILCFYVNFSFYPKVPSHFDLESFFWNIFTPSFRVMFSTDLHYSIFSK